MKKISVVFFLLAFIFVVGCSSEAKQKEVTIEIPSNLSFSNNNLSWDSVSNAEAYIVDISGQDTVELSGTTYEFNSGGNSFSFRVKAIYTSEQDEESEIIYLDSSFSEALNVTYLDQATNFVVQDGGLFWDAVDEADGYVLRINGVEQEPVFTNFYDDFPAGDTSTVFVRPIKDGTGNNIYTSQYSNETTITPMRSPILGFDNGSQTISWNPVDGAEGYALKIYHDGSVVHTGALGASTFTYEYGFLLSGDYEVMLKTTASGESITDSKYSVPLKIHRLKNPEKTSLSEGTSSGSTNILFTDVEMAVSYEVRVNDVIISLMSRNSFEYSFPSSRDENIASLTITSKGDGQYILDALDVQEFELTRLSAPVNIVFNEGVISWSNVNKNSGYIVVVDGNEYVVQTNQYDLGVLEAGAHTVRVKTRGNGEYYVDSSYSVLNNFTKLSAPSNLVISNNVLSWNAVPGTSSYKIKIGDLPPQYTTNTSYTINASDISENTAINITALGNSGNILDSNASDTKVVYRLSAPTSLSVNNDFIIWNEVPNAKEYLLEINSMQYIVQGTSFNWEGISHGDKNITVTARGDGQEYFTSQKSGILSVIKLNKPTLRIENNKINWDHISGSDGYEVLIDGQSFSLGQQSRDFEYTFSEPGNYEIHLRALGNETDSVASSYDTISHNVSILQTPYGNPAFTIERVGQTLEIKLTNTIEKAIGYNINIGGVDFYSEDGSLVYEISDAGTYNIRVSAVGDGFNNINSNYTNERQIEIISTVQNATFRYEDTDFYMLRWDPVNNATSYKVFITKVNSAGQIISGPTEFPQSSTSLLVSTEDTFSVLVEIIALGDGATRFDSITYSETFVPQGE